MASVTELGAEAAGWLPHARECVWSKWIWVWKRTRRIEAVLQSTLRACSGGAGEKPAGSGSAFCPAGVPAGRRGRRCRMAAPREAPARSRARGGSPRRRGGGAEARWRARPLARGAAAAPLLRALRVPPRGPAAGESRARGALGPDAAAGPGRAPGGRAEGRSGPLPGTGAGVRAGAAGLCPGRGSLSGSCRLRPPGGERAWLAASCSCRGWRAPSPQVCGSP